MLGVEEITMLFFVFVSVFMGKDYKQTRYGKEEKQNQLFLLILLTLFLHAVPHGWCENWKMSIWLKLIFVTIRILTNWMMFNYLCSQRCFKVALQPPHAWRCIIHRKKRWHCVPSKVQRKTFMLKSVSFLCPDFTGREEIAAKSILAAAYLYTYPCPFWNVFYTESLSHWKKASLLQRFYIT